MKREEKKGNGRQNKDKEKDKEKETGNGMEWNGIKITFVNYR